MRYALDTHTLVWHLTGDSRLGDNARQILNDPDALLILPLLVLAEAKHIAERKRISISFQEIMESVVASPRITIAPLDIFTLAHMSSDLDIHDGLIVATALSSRDLLGEPVTVLTRDKAITESGLVPVLW